MKNELKKLNDIENSLTAPWELKGMTAEDYAKDLTKRWEGINDLLNGRRTDTSIVKSTITETIEFITWAYAKKELTQATALIKVHLQKARGNRAWPNQSKQSKGELQG